MELSEKEFEIEYNKIAPFLLKYIGKQLNGDFDTAKDIFHTAILIGWEKRGKINPETTKFKTYVYGVTKNLLLNHFKYQSYFGTGKFSQDNFIHRISDFNVLDPEELLLGKEKKEKIEKKISLIMNHCDQNHDETYKSLLLDFYWDNLSAKEIAEKRGLSPKYVKSKLFRIRRELEKDLTSKIS